jgi:glycosyltransferase involved in cell wall biosynthesis
MVTVVLCTHNDSELLMPALESCLRQDTEVEVVLVDDASTKPLPVPVWDFITEHKNMLRYIRHSENRGLSAARNTGIGAARGDLVIPLDADDYLFPNVLGRLSEALARDGADVAYGNLWIGGHLDFPIAQPWNKDLLRRMNPIFCSSLFKKSIWEKVGGYLVREGPHYEDWQFWNKCFLAGAKFTYLNTIIYEHVNRPEGMLNKLGADRKKYITIATECLGL